MKLVFIFALLALGKVVVLYKVYHRLPLTELKRRARSRQDPQASAIYKVAATGRMMDTFLYLIGIASTSILLVMSARYSWWFAVTVILAVSWLILASPSVKVGGWLWRMSAFSSTYTFKLLMWLRPALELVSKLMPKNFHVHSGAYEKEDLLEIISLQKTQPDNRIAKEDLMVAAGALTFGDKLVRDVMTPRRVVRFVGEDDVVGPLLIDELHKSGFSRFPVTHGPTKAAAPQVIGTLYLHDITEISQENKGRAKELMHKGVCYINEACNLRQALDAVLKHHKHQLVVVNNFEEMTGVLTLEDILEQVIGQKIVDEFDKYEDMRAVAGLQAAHEHAKHAEVAQPPLAEVKNHNEETVAPTSQ